MDMVKFADQVLAKHGMRKVYVAQLRRECSWFVTEERNRWCHAQTVCPVDNKSYAGKVAKDGTFYFDTLEEARAEIADAKGRLAVAIYCGKFGSDFKITASRIIRKWVFVGGGDMETEIIEEA